MAVEIGRKIFYSSKFFKKKKSKVFFKEQISLLLDVKSFKRKYSEMFRRTILPSEREYLLDKCKLADNLAPHLHSDLTALRAADVHDLIANDYPSIYAVNKAFF